MTFDCSEFRSLMLDISRELEQRDVDALVHYFHLDGVKDSISLLNELETLGKISAHDVTELFLPLNRWNLQQLVKRLQEYQDSVKNNPVLTHWARFIGRGDEMDMIVSHFDNLEIPSKFRVVFISGMPGIGKTWLSDEVSRHLMTEDQCQRHFVSCRGLRRTSDVVELLKDELEVAASDTRVFARALAQKLESSPRSQLIVVDNVEDAMEYDQAIFNGFLIALQRQLKAVSSKRHRLIVTSRKKLPMSVVKELQPELLAVRLDKMSMEGSKQLFGKYLGTRKLTISDVEVLASLCGFHPLSMALVANRLRLQPSVSVENVTEELKREPIGTLRHLEDLKDLDTCSSIEGTFEHIFLTLKGREQELLIALGAAPFDMKEETASAISGLPPSAFTPCLWRLLDFSLIKEERQNKQSRYSMHLLTRHFLMRFCQHESCSVELRKSFKRAHKRLVEVYTKEMKQLARLELCRPSLFATEVKYQRLNYLPMLGQVYDALITRETKCHVFMDLEEVKFRVMFSVPEQIEFLKERIKKASKTPGCFHIQSYLRMNLADRMRASNRVREAKSLMQGLEKEVMEATLSDETRRELRTYCDRFYGRCLKDQTDGNVYQALIESKRRLEEAIRGFQDEALFPDVELRDKQTSVTHYDLGNTCSKLTSHYQDHSLIVEWFKKAQGHYKETKKLLQKYNRNAIKLFDVYLGLASCEMELRSWFVAGTPDEDSVSLMSALELYTRAGDILKQSGQVILQDPVRMGYFHYSRAVCHHRAQNHEAAALDARKGYRIQRQVFGVHGKTVSSLLLLGNVYNNCRGIERRAERSFKCYEKALCLLERLHRRGKAVSEGQIVDVEERLMVMTARMKKDFEEYRLRIDNIKSDVNVDSDGDSSCDSDDKLDHPTAQELKKAFDAENNDLLPEDRNSSAPTCAQARQLSAELQELMRDNADELRNMDNMELTSMDIVRRILISGYINMDDKTKQARYDKGLRYCKSLREMQQARRAKVPSVRPTNQNARGIEPHRPPIRDQQPMKSAISSDEPGTVGSVSRTVPSREPEAAPSRVSVAMPSEEPETIPSRVPEAVPSGESETIPSRMPEAVPSRVPETIPFRVPEAVPSRVPEAVPSRVPEAVPSEEPETIPSRVPEAVPSRVPETIPFRVPEAVPSRVPEAVPSRVPEAVPSEEPETIPSRVPEAVPSRVPETIPFRVPEAVPSRMPEAVPSGVPEAVPSGVPDAVPSGVPETIPSRVPEAVPSRVPEAVPSGESETIPSRVPEAIPSVSQTNPSVQVKILSNVPSTTPSGIEVTVRLNVPTAVGLPSAPTNPETPLAPSSSTLPLPLNSNVQATLPPTAIPSAVTPALGSPKEVPETLSDDFPPEPVSTLQRTFGALFNYIQNEPVYCVCVVLIFVLSWLIGLYGIKRQ